MEETLRALARARAELFDCQTEELVYITELQNTPEWANLENAKAKTRNASNEVAQYEEEVRREALQHYMADGNKAISKGVAVKIFKRIAYDAKEAEEWCRQNAPALFRWDAKGFEKAATTLPGAPIAVVEDPRVTIATDLSEYLS